MDNSNDTQNPRTTDSDDEQVETASVDHIHYNNEEDSNAVMNNILLQTNIVGPASSTQQSRITTDSNRVVQLCSTRSNRSILEARALLPSIVTDKDLATLRELGGTEGIAELVDSNLVTGICSSTTSDEADDAQEDLRRRRDTYGTNKYHGDEQQPTTTTTTTTTTTKKSFIYYFLNAFKSWSVFLFIVCGSLTMGFDIKAKGLKNGWQGGTLIFGSIFAMVASNTITNYFCSKRSQNVEVLLPSTLIVDVLRHGLEQKISIFDIVVGDVVLLKMGDRIPADGLFINGTDIERQLVVAAYDEDVSSLIDGVANPCLCAGATVIQGYGKMLVISVGMNTKWGKFLSTEANNDVDSLKHRFLQDGLDKLNAYIQYIVWILIALTVLGFVVRFCLHKLSGNNASHPVQINLPTEVAELMKAMEGLFIKARGLTISLTVIFALLQVGIQQGLSLTITLSLWYWRKKMWNCHMIIIHKLCSFVTMSSVTDICVDPEGLTMKKETVNGLRRAGVCTRLISTGSLLDARAKAIELGILGTGRDLNNTALVIEAEDFWNYSKKERMEKVDQIIVMGNSLPSEKLLFLRCLKRKGHVVAFTLTRTIDVTVLKEADVGFLKGTKNSERAKKISDIAVLDGNLDSIFTVLWFGRCAYQNIRKFIQFELTINLSGLMITLLTVVYLGDTPMSTPLQLVLVDLILGIVAALALLIEPPTKELLETLPVNQLEPLITKVMFRNIITQVNYQAAVLLIFLLKGNALSGINRELTKTIIFNSFLLFHIFNLFNAREPEKKDWIKGIILHGNCWRFVLAVGAPIVLQVAVVEFAYTLIGTGRLNRGQWLACILYAMTSCLIDCAVKCISSLFANWSMNLRWLSGCLTPSSSADSTSIV